MTQQALTSVVRERYNRMNVDTEIVCRCSNDHLTLQQQAVFDCLSDDIKLRYHGPGLVIPENVKGKRVLDIGCGSGSLVFILSKMVGPTGYVVGIDLSDGLIQTAKDQSDYHCQLWGYDKPNFEFHAMNAEQLDEANFRPGYFDIIMSNGVFCLIPDKERVFRTTYKLLKAGGQFYLKDMISEKDVPEKCKDNQTLWSLGATGAMRWDTLATLAVSAGFTSPHLTSAVPIDMANDDYNNMLEYGRYTCAGWRLFKLDTPAKAANQGPALVTYNGGITDFPDAFPWDVDITFKKGVGVEVDEELATLLSSIYLSDCFSFQPASGHPVTCQAQNPFQLMDELEAEGKLPEPIFKIE